MCWPCKLMSNHIASALALLAMIAASAVAQPRNEIPRSAYYAASNEFYRGEYRDAERDFRRLTRSGVRSTQARWIDSVCYHAMLGEVLYHQGRNAEALNEFDQACLLLLTYPDFMARVKFEDPRPMGKSARQPPWGIPTRRFVLGDYSETMQVLMGDLGGAQRVAREGGTFMQPQFWRVNVAEIVRSAAIAIRRRNEILGPLGKYDRISKELSATFARRGLVPPNHWSQAWIELLEGLAKAGVGLNDEAQAHLARAVIVLGRWDHPLTGFALVEQGRLALAAGDHRAAASLLSEASYSGFFYEDLDVVNESLRLGWTNHRASGAGGAYPPLEAAAAWAEANRLDHVATQMRLAQAENMVRQGQLPPAATALAEAQRQIGTMRGSRADIELKYLRALLDFAQPTSESTRGRRDMEQAATAELYRALAAQSTVSLRNFQVMLANERFDSRELSPRLAVILYGVLLGDPLPSHWAQQPFDTLAVLKTPHDDAFDRWFLAALDRKNLSLALDIAEWAKRARFLSSLPLGGRLLAMRELLESPASQLSVAAALERQQLLASAPAYRDLSTAAARLGAQLRDGPLVALANDGNAAAPEAVNSQSLHEQFEAWRQNTDAREQILLRMALSPLPSTLVFPPQRSTLELQHSLAPGEALMVFHVAGGNLFGLLVSRDAQHVWKIDDARRLQRAIGDLLKSLGNFGRSRELSSDDLTNDEWRVAAAELRELIFAGSRLEWDKTTRLVIVPDDWLWYVPFEALIAPGGEELLADRVPMHYGPTASLAVGDTRPFRRPRHTGILASDSFGNDGDDAEGGAISSLSEAVVGAVPLALPLAEPGYLMAPLMDGLVVFDDLEVDPKHPYDWSPLARGGGRRSGRSGKAADSLIGWMGLPYAGPERIALAGFSTAAENGLKGVDRTVAGREMFYAVCGLMAGGGRTVLISRWRTGGQVNVQMIREFVQELPHATAADAWQRSMLLARESPLDAAAEPRLKKLDTAAEPPSADHPFFWAGYQLIDTGTRPQADDEPIEDPQADAAAKPGQQ